MSSRIYIGNLPMDVREREVSTVIPGGGGWGRADQASEASTLGERELFVEGGGSVAGKDR